MLTFNGQTELLNGVDQHGETSHYIRPDAVYMTGVVQPTAGFQPVRDSEMIANEFAQGQLAPGVLAGVRNAQLLGLAGQRAQLLGLHGAGLGFFNRIKLWFQGAFSKMQAAAIVKQAVAAQAAATGQSTAAAATQLFNTALPNGAMANDYPGSAPAGAQNAQQAAAAENIVNGSGTQQYQTPPTQSANQSAAGIAPKLFLAPAALARISAPSGKVGPAAVTAATQRFFAANKGRVG